MSDSVLVDTSVWISFFRDSDQKVSDKLKHLLRNGAPVYTGLMGLSCDGVQKAKKSWM